MKEETQSEELKKLALIVDDDGVARRIMGRKLVNQGFVVDFAGNPHKALSLIRQRMAAFQVYSVVFTDYSMAEPSVSSDQLNGAQFIVAIRMMGGHYATIPIIGITSQAEEMQAELKRFFGEHTLAGELKFFQKTDPKRFGVVDLFTEKSRGEVHSPIRKCSE